MNFLDQLQSASERKESTVTFKPINFIGVEKVDFVALNPTAKEKTELFNLKQAAKEPLPYTNTIDVDGKQIKSVRLDFYVRGYKESPIKSFANKIFMAPFTITLEDRADWNFDKSKITVIDEFGQYCRMTVEEFKTKKIKINKLGIPIVSKNFRAAKVGEVALIRLLRTLFNIPSPLSVNAAEGIKTYKMKAPEELEACKLVLDDKTWDELFKGNVDFLKKFFSPNDEKTKQAKVMFGTKINNGKEFQTIAREVFIPANSLKYNEFEGWLEYHCKDRSIWNFSPTSLVEKTETNSLLNTLPTLDSNTNGLTSNPEAEFIEDDDMPF